MSEYAERQGYSRVQYNTRKRKNVEEVNNSFAIVFVRQLLISIFLFSIVLGIKSIDSTITKNVSDKIGQFITAEYQLDDFFKNIDFVVKKVGLAIPKSNG